jgi:hypothetical protein
MKYMADKMLIDHLHVDGLSSNEVLRIVKVRARCCSVFRHLKLVLLLMVRVVVAQPSRAMQRRKSSLRLSDPGLGLW